ncbi:MAG TPA: hypothetical protein VG796_22390 [Verrucomicrobiales bacterium]|nr:hypothetical protein [Verrucomicrobiales bacterium]
MGVFYSVAPLDDSLAACFREVGVELPQNRGYSRNPTPQEARDVCLALTEFNVEAFAPPECAWRIVIMGRKDSPAASEIDYETEPWTTLNVHDFDGNETTPHTIWFEKGWPALILRIVHALTEKCGTLIIIPDTGCKPLAVRAADDVRELYDSWEHALGCPFW